MGLLDGYDDPDQFDASGGLLGGLLSVQRQQGLLPSNFIFPTSPGPVPAPAPLRQRWPDAPTLPVSSQEAAFTPKADPRDAQGQLASNDLAASGVKSGLRTALDDFYQQSIRQAGRDIAGYAHDAVNDPMGFLHAIGPTLGAAGPAASELPATIRGIVGAITAARGARSENLGDLTPGEIRQI
ncbi:hypothetical protein ACQR1W_35335 [Bradyrhizobium sp. HKCCYLS1011]|uniref:hypothetical protein n=1 Tax=Bradyrhizobium sp. HKCCYLS1011 TaxID=3420733 RepID=UPI003EBE7519